MNFVLVDVAKAMNFKNFNEAAIAQGLLEVAKKKMEHAMEQTKQCSNKRIKLDRNKKRTKKRKDSR
jgi:hypothetical protein